MTIRSYPCIALLYLILATRTTAQAQDKLPVKFGKVTPQDFTVTAAGLDSSADAVVIADYGTSEFEGDPRGWFTLTFKHSKRIRILKRTG